MSGPVLDFDPQAARSVRQGDTREVPGAFEALAAGFGTARVDTTGYVEAQQVEAYKPIIDALLEVHADRSFTAYVNPSSGTVSPQAVWRDVQRLKRDRGMFADLPDTIEEFEQGWRKDERLRIAKLQETASRGGAVPVFIGSMAGAMTDPINIYSLPVGGAGKSLATRMLTEGLVNSAVEAALLPTAQKNRAELGLDGLTVGDAALNIAAAGFGAAALRGGFEIAPRVASAVDAKAYALAKPVRDAIDGKLGDRDLARAFADMVPEHLRTPDQEAALYVLTRAADIREASPYIPTHEAIDAHVAKLEVAANALAEGRIASEADIAGSGLGIGEEIAVRTARNFNLTGARGQVASTLADAGYSDAVVSGFLGNFEVEGGYTGALGDSGSASGIAQWRHERRENFRRLYGKDPHQASAAEQVEFVLWEMRNPTEAGMTVAQRDAILRARTPEEAAELIDQFYERSSGEHRARRAQEARRFHGGEAGDVGALTEGVDPLAIRPDALDAERPLVNAGVAAVPIARFAADDIGVDAELMQFKSGGDAFGVTERLQGIEEWDPISAGMVTVWEGNDGRRLIADGHQRLGLARRIQAARGEPIELNAFVLRESDGFSAIDARIVTALKNIGEGTGTATDAAKIFRDAGLDIEDLKRRLPPRSALVRDGKALARLDDEAFGAVINDVIPENYGAAIGELVPDRGLHMAMVRILNETDPPNRVQAEAIIRQAREAGFTKETQDSLFGSEELVTGLFAQRAKVLDRGLKELRKMKGAFQVAVRNADTLEQGGNRIDINASEAAAAGNARALALVDKLALRKGNAVNEILDQAARRLAAGEPLARVLRDFVGSVQKLDLDDLAREAGSARGAGDGAGGGGRAGEPEIESRFDDDAALNPRDADAAIAAGETTAPLFDDAMAARFDEPDGEGVRAASESVWHDIRAQEDFAAPTAEQRRIALEKQAEGRQKGNAPQKSAGEDGGLFDTQGTTGDLFDLDDGKGARSAADIRAEIDGDRSAIEEIRKCLK